MPTTKITTGTREWADHNANCVFGCTHDCKYCYAKRMAIRFNRKTVADWNKMVINDREVRHRYRFAPGRFMYPTTHDLVPDDPTFDACMTKLQHLLEPGNKVLVTTKPHLDAIGYICDTFASRADQIQFRFTITSNDDAKLAYWEPDAPKFLERVRALKRALAAGFRTSISMEPCLESDPRDLVAILQPFVTESIWLGIMNYCGEHEFNSVATIQAWQEWFSNNSLIRFKDSCQRKLAREVQKCKRS